MLTSMDGELSCVALAGYARDRLEAAPVAPAYRAALAAALALPGNILSCSPNLRWARPVHACCVAAGGRGEQAVPIAAAVEVFMVALDLLDDLEDGETNPLQVGLGTASSLNAAMGLLFLAQHCLAQEPNGASAAAILVEAGLRAGSGQHADLAPAADGSLTLDEALAVTSAKSGSLVAAICRLGAFAAGADGDVQARYARFGGYLGVAAQLANDIEAIAPAAAGKTDLALGRPTLPLVYAGARDAAEEHEDVAAALWAEGAAHFTWAVAATYRQHAQELIPSLTGDPAAGAALAALLQVL